MEERAMASGLGEAVRQVLLHVWDPIGVRGVPQAQDEYDGYVGPVLRAVVDGAGVDEVRVLLDRLAVRDMGLAAGSGDPVGAAELLVGLTRGG